MPGNGLQSRVRDALLTAHPPAKAAAARTLLADWKAGRLVLEPDPPEMPRRPGRPSRPVLLPPRDMPRRRKAGAAQNRIALLHAVAHIEFNAIDLALDITGRFAGANGPEFVTDWLAVADEEALHFLMVTGRLADLGARYGDLPAHDGLWEAAEETGHDLCARLAVAHMVLEARGLDVTPGMIERFRRHGDDASADVLQRIYTDEIGHVGTGAYWFRKTAGILGENPDEYWRALVRTHFRGKLKRPFNKAARDAAQMPSDLYEPLAEETGPA